MNKSVTVALICAFCSIFLTVNIFGQSFQYNNANPNQYNKKIAFSGLDSAESKAKSFAFSNPVIAGYNNGCSNENLKNQRFSAELTADEKVLFCDALQKVSDELNGNSWSPELATELQEIWKVFLTEKVRIYPMKKGVSKRIVAAAEAFTENQKGSGFNASLYLRPESVKKKSFFLSTMHELRHVFDFYLLWKTQTGITEAELEKRGFRIMGKIASETARKESFYRLPKVWDEGWKSLSRKEIFERREQKINSFMRKSRFYKRLMNNPQKHIVGYRSNVLAEERANPIKIKRKKGGRLPYLVKTKQSKYEIPQQVNELTFEPAKTIDPKNHNELLRNALLNEKNLYYKMDNFVYDQSLNLQCWKKDKVRETFFQSKQIARTDTGETLLEDEKTVVSSKKKNRIPSCILNLGSIITDSTDTFWAAPYLEEMKINFDYFEELDGIRVARYTVYKPTEAKFEQIAEKYPFVKPFRVFFGTIFVSVEDSQIIKFWGSSYPESQTTGVKPGETLASYNATAVRRKLKSGIWVTTKIDTVAVANKKGKMKPFNYVVRYENYRQSTSEVLILDDEEILDSEG